MSRKQRGGNRRKKRVLQARRIIHEAEKRELELASEAKAQQSELAKYPSFVPVGGLGAERKEEPAPPAEEVYSRAELQKIEQVILTNPYPLPEESYKGVALAVSRMAMDKTVQDRNRLRAAQIHSALVKTNLDFAKQVRAREDGDADPDAPPMAGQTNVQQKTSPQGEPQGDVNLATKTAV